MTTYRKARPEDRAQYLDFINMVFSMAHRPHDFSKLLPKVYGPGRPTDTLQNIAVADAGRVRGPVAVLPGALRGGDKALCTGYVGSVSAHPFARGEGHMKALMKMAIEGAAADGADLMMLGGQRQRYEYFGFTPGGVEIRYTVDQANLRHALRGVETANPDLDPLNLQPGQKLVLPLPFEVVPANIRFNLCKAKFFATRSR